MTLPDRDARIKVKSRWGKRCIIYPCTLESGSAFEIMVDAAIKVKVPPHAFPDIVDNLLDALRTEQASALHGTLVELPSVMFVVGREYLLLTDDEELRTRAWDTETGAEDLAYNN